MPKTTIAIDRDYRDKLGMIKNILENKKEKFIDMDEVVGYLLDNLPAEMDDVVNRR